MKRPGAWASGVGASGTRAGFGGAAALAALLALSACATGELADETVTVAEAAGESPALADGVLPLPKPRQEPGASAAAEADAAGDDAPDDAASGIDDPASDKAPDKLAAADAQPPADLAAAADAPHVYMSLQPDRAGSTSVVFAIDRSRDGTPSDEPAIRITPEETDAQTGRCNPQQLRYYKFPPESAGRPVYGPDEASRGVDARTLPEFMATAVSAEMMERGLADDLEETRPQNVCTRKLFEQTIIAATTGQG
jgi:hypothetical protein